jgi:hypothetical protein
MIYFQIKYSSQFPHFKNWTTNAIQWLKGKSHCFQTIAKLTAMAQKEPLLPHRLHITVDERGREVKFLLLLYGASKQIGQQYSPPCTSKLSNPDDASKQIGQQ